MEKSDELVEKLNKLKQQSGAWQVGLVKAHLWVEHKKGEVYRPFMMLAVNEQKVILGTRIFDQYPTPVEIWQELARWMRRPMPGAGVARRPQQILLENPQMAEELAPRLARIGVETLVQPSLSALHQVLEELYGQMGQGEPDLPGIWKSSGVTEPLARALYQLSAEFYRLAPWTKLQNEYAFKIQTNDETEPRFVVVMGMAGEQFGISVNDRIEDLAEMISGKPIQKWKSSFTWLVLSFETPDYLPFDDLDAAEMYHWQFPAD